MKTVKFSLILVLLSYGFACYCQHVEDTDYDEEKLEGYGIETNKAKKLAKIWHDFLNSMFKCSGQDEQVKAEAHKSDDTFSKCIGEIAKEMRPAHNLDDKINILCKRKPKYSKCVKNLTTELSPCISNEDKIIIPFVEDIIEALHHFICFEGGQTILSLIEDLIDNEKRSKLCPNTIVQDIRICQNAGLEKLLRNVTHLRDLVIYSFKDCKSIEETYQCLRTVLRSCRDSRPVQLLDNINKSVKKFTHCGRVNSSAIILQSISTLFIMLAIFINLL